MNIHKFSLVAALALGGLLACANVSPAQDNNATTTHHRGQRQPPSVEQQMERLTKTLNLTDEQKPKVKALLEERNKQFQEMRKDSSLTQEQRREKFRTMRQEENKKLKAILTPDQMEKYQNMRRNGRRGRQNGQNHQGQ